MKWNNLCKTTENLWELHSEWKGFILIIYAGKLDKSRVFGGFDVGREAAGRKEYSFETAWGGVKQNSIFYNLKMKQRKVWRFQWHIPETDNIFQCLLFYKATYEDQTRGGEFHER